MNICKMILAALITLSMGGIVDAQVAGPSGLKGGKKGAPKKVGPKNHEGPGGKLDPEKVRKKSTLDKYQQTDTSGPKVAVVKAGAMVGGKTAAGTIQRIRFEGVRGAEVDLELFALDRSLTGKATLRGPALDEVAKLKAVKAKPGTYSLKSFELTTSGVHTVEVVLGATGEFRLSTKIKVPSRYEDDREWKEGRPHRILLGGMTDRSLTDLTIRAKDRSLGMTFTARLYDPDGLPVDLSPYLKLSHAGSTLSLRKMPLGIPGDYELFVADKSRATGEAAITARFNNPPMGSGKVRL